MTDKKLTPEQLQNINYVNLNSHSMYSLLMGFGSLKELIRVSHQKGHKGFALTDLGSMRGILDLYTTSSDKNLISSLGLDVKKYPIVMGADLYTTDHPHIKDKNKKYNQLTFLAYNEKGYKNLSKLTSEGSLSENFYKKSRVPLESIFSNSEGLIVTSGCAFGYLAESIHNNGGSVQKLLKDAIKENKVEELISALMTGNHSSFDSVAMERMSSQPEANLIPKVLQIQEVCQIIKNSQGFPIQRKYIDSIMALDDSLFSEEAKGAEREKEAQAAKHLIIRLICDYTPEEIVEKFQKVFKDNFYLEFTPHDKSAFWSSELGSHDYHPTNPHIKVTEKFIELSKKYNIKCILTQESFLPEEKHHSYQCIMIWNSPGNKGWAFEKPQAIMSVEEMYEMVKENYPMIDDQMFTQMCQNSFDILNKAKDCTLSFKPSLPSVDYREHYVNKVPIVIRRALMLELQDIGVWDEDIKERIKLNKSIQNEELPAALKEKYNTEDKVIDFEDMKVREQENIVFEKILSEMEEFYKDKEPGFHRVLMKSRNDLEIRTALKVSLKNKKLIPKEIDMEAMDAYIAKLAEKNPKLKGKKAKDFPLAQIHPQAEKHGFIKLTSNKMDYLGDKARRDRMVEEINTIQYNGILKLTTYFMLLEDISNFHKENGYLYGLGRGSGAGSLYAYALDITDVEPLEYGLLFERFLTTERIGEVYWEQEGFPLKEYSKSRKEDIDTKFEKLKSLIIKDRDIDALKEDKDKELFFLECNENFLDYVLNVKDAVKSPIPNKQNSTVMFLIGVTDQAPTGSINASPTTLPDIDYDTMARDEVKKYLVKKFGIQRVTLMGTFGTLKTKGTIKDVLRQLRPEISFAEVNDFTKNFDEETGKGYELPGRLGFKSEREFFKSYREAVPQIRDFFQDNPDVLEAVEDMLETVKTTGVHAGGIVVAGDDVPFIVPCTFDNKKDFMLITEPDMNHVEWAGLIKYDFLGLNTLFDIVRAFRQIEKRHGKILTYSKISKSSRVIYQKFIEGDTMSVFQFNKDWVKRILKQLKEVKSVEDLAIITSILRPGPMEMGMHETFIKRVNGEEAIEYMHPSLEEILKDTYGIIVFQEQVMATVRKLGGLTGNESVVVLKAMGKKQLDKLLKFKEKFIKNSIEKYPDMAEKVKFSDPETGEIIEVSLSEKIWLYLQAFAKYGFNKSHAIAYSTISYICMWLKHYYPIEWTTAVMSGASKDDFKEFYSEWYDKILKPDINQSKIDYVISKVNGEDKTLMPFSFIEGVGGKAVDAIVSEQPFADFADFFDRVDHRKVNKKCFIHLILSGSFDSLNIEKKEDHEFRLDLLHEFYNLRREKRGTKKKGDDKKTLAKAEEAEIEVFFKEYDNKNRGGFLMDQITLLNLTSFDYMTFYKQHMKEGAQRLFGQEAISPGEAQKRRNNSSVVVGGAIGDKRYIKTKKDGREMVFLTIVNGDEKISITVFPDQLERDNDGRNPIRDAEINTPIVLMGTVNEYNGKVGLIYKKGWLLK